jgi:hypothetical protein
MFAEPSILEIIASVTLALRQYEGAGGSALLAAPEAAEGVLEEFAAGVESDAVASAPSLTREDQGTSLPEPAEAVASAAAATVADAAESVVREAGPSSPRLVTAAAEEVLVPGSPPRPLKSTSPPRARQGLPPRDPKGRGGHWRDFVAGRRER